MTEEKKLYPMRFCPLVDEYSWGTEEFVIADLGYRDSLVKDGWLAANTISEVMDTYMDRVVGDRVFDRFGRQFPVQLKKISCKGSMPLRVHPDDETAVSRFDALGKEKLWYVQKASKDARIFLGFAENVDAASLISGAEDSTIVSKLNAVAPKAGDFFHIAPGTVHGAAGNLEIIEVSESSAMDFCICSWGEPVGPEEFDSDCTVVEALDFINYAPYVAEALPKADKGMLKLVDLPQFTARKIDLKDPLHITNEGNDSFAIYHCLYGEAAIKAAVEGVEMDYRIKAGETLMVPSETDDFVLSPTAQTTAVLEVLIEKGNPADPYINPDVEATLPGEE